MIFKRKLYDKLLAWKANQADKTALLIEGARRVGKSTLAKAFGANEYRSYIVVDFWEASQEVKDAFSQNLNNLDALFRFLQLHYATRLYEHDSLIVLDEVQLHPTARSAVKQLVADGRYHYIETGSLLSIKQNVSGAPIPSEEVSARLCPLDFEEFLWACGNDVATQFIRESFATKEPLPDGSHRDLMRTFREYLLVGGMPQSVEAFLARNSFQEADDVKRAILDLYRKDITRFAAGYEGKVRRAFDAIPSQLSKHEKKFTVSAMGHHARIRDYQVAFEWMSEACVTNMCWSVTDPCVGLALYEDDGAFKCYMVDTGLLVTHALADRATTSNKIYEDVLTGKLSINEGMITENVVAQQLVASGHRLRFYSSYASVASDRMEIDFLVAREYSDAGGKARVSPIEVKSSNRYGLSSLDKFKTKFGKRVGTQFVLHPKTLSVEGDRVFLPLYMAHLV
ncbi:ATP-binding protein [Adlercreutzia sp. ZJ154]|uniref:ATP-binding protein n=1 Tax=Adlercreutzia sp. ZJ154 TaxID=2709790 RepID=UPI0013EC781D|nr:ATP-binding protein [Adlercreutzia sp. ZJ154]